MENKRHIARLLLLIAALAIGGGLGNKLLVVFEPIKITLFIVSIIILGEIFIRSTRRY